MATQHISRITLFFQRLPLPLFALVIGLAAGAATWLVVDRVQTRALSKIFNEALDNQLHQVARESLIHFDEHRRSFVYLARLLANHRGMASYLDPIIWWASEDDLKTYEEHPPWLPREKVWRDLAQPSHLILADMKGGLREHYSLDGAELPDSLLADSAVYLAASEQRAFLTTLDDTPYLVVSEPVQDAGFYPMGSLVLLVPLDHDFLAAAQQAVRPSQSVVAIIDPDAHVILSSSDPFTLDAGVSLESLADDYVVTAQSFFDYDDSDLNMLFATLMPVSYFRETGQAVLDLERRQRAMGAGGIIAVFVMLIVLISSRLNATLQRLHEFASKALGKDYKQGDRGGNQLLLLEDRLRDVIALVLKAREETRTRHESEVQQIESLRVAVMEASLDSIVTIDAVGKIIDFNPTAQTIFGQSHTQALGRELASMVFDEQSAEYFRDLLLETLSMASKHEASDRYELTAIDREGRDLEVEVAIKPVRLQDQLLFTVYIRDIAEQRRQQAEIRSLAAFPEESPSPILRVNDKGVVSYANAPSMALLHYWGCLPMQTLPVFWKDQVEEVLRTGDDQELEVNLEDGVFSLLMTPVPDLGYVNIYARDITAQRRAEDALQQRQTELVHVARLSTMGEMSTGLAHELNQPLSAIVNFSNGCARRLSMDVGGKEELLSALSQITLQANRAAEIIKRLRSMVTRQATKRSEVDLNHLVHEICELLAHDLRKSQIAVERKLYSEELKVRVDTVQLEQALINLVRNALDSMQHLVPLERRLVISTGYVAPEQVYVSVKDWGEGIDEGAMEHLFDAFYSTKETGMGMGLAITQTIVENHHGRLYASSSKGKGSTFTIELPEYLESTESLAS